MSALTGTWSECFFANKADYTAVASTAVEATLLAGQNEQPVIPALFFHQRERKAIRLTAEGVFSTTGTPTMIWQIRTSTTQGASTLSGSSLGVTAAITTGSGVSNQQFRLVYELVCTAPGLGTGNCTLQGAGLITSPGGFASPFAYAVQITTPPTATWTQTIDGALTQYLNLSLTWSASSASNTCTLKKLLVEGLN